MRLLLLALAFVGFGGLAPSAQAPAAQSAVTITLVRWPFT